MKVTILGISRRKADDKTGRPVTYSNLYYSEPFDDYAASNGECAGVKCGNVNTGLDTSALFVGDVVNLDYAPSGFTDRNGSPQFRLVAIDVIQAASNPFGKDKASK